MSYDSPTTIDVIACVDCAALDRIDPATVGAATGDPCGCGCGWFWLLCQLCGRKIGEGSTGGTIDLGDVPDVAVRFDYRALFQETRPTALELADAPDWDD